MKTIETTIQVDEKGIATFDVKDDVEPGEYRAHITVEDNGRKSAIKEIDLPKISIGKWPWPEDYTFRREDMYDERGR